MGYRRKKAVLMCGIFGISYRKDESLPSDFLNNATSLLNQLKHRGPDDTGHQIFEKNFMGMTRLAIIDASLGLQPMVHEDGFALVFNGEIYNYKELTQQLENYTKFRTASDTEVILNAYSVWGIDFIDKLEGMFAIALLDFRVNKLFLIRDRYGKKPIYYQINEKNVMFSSESKILYGRLSVLDLNIENMKNYMQVRFTPIEGTIFKSVKKVLPGEYLCVDLHTLDCQSVDYYKPIISSFKLGTDDKVVAKTFKTLFEKSVEKRISASDVPVGLFLSGGLDSSSIVVAAKNLGFADIQAFSVGFNSINEDERSKAKFVANLLGIKLTEVEITPESFWKLLPKVVASQDEPISDLASVPLYALSEIAAEKVKVVLSGEGADETLFGYDFNRLLLKKNIAQFTKTYLPTEFQNLIPNKNLRLFLQSKENNFLKFSKPYISEIFSAEEVSVLFRDKSHHDDNSIISRWYNEENITDIRGIAKLYRTTWMVDDLLQRTDRVSMAHGLEVRAPFLDHVFVEWIDSLPLKLNLNAGLHVKNTKILLRKYASSYLPRKIIEQQKKGFTIPSDSWLVYKPDSNLNFFLMNDSSLIYNFISKKEVLKLIKNIGTSTANNSRIWNLIILEMWLKAHANK